MNEKLKLIPIHEEDVIEDEMLNFITAGDAPAKGCNPNRCGENTGNCTGVNECNVNSADCTTENRCGTNASTEKPKPSGPPVAP